LLELAACDGVCVCDTVVERLADAPRELEGVRVTLLVLLTLLVVLGLTDLVVDEVLEAVWLAVVDAPEVRVLLTDFVVEGVRVLLNDFVVEGVRVLLTDFVVEGVRVLLTDFVVEGVRVLLTDFVVESVRVLLIDFVVEGVRVLLTDFVVESVRVLLIDFVIEGVRVLVIDCELEGDLLGVALAKTTVVITVVDVWTSVTSPSNSVGVSSAIIETSSVSVGEPSVVVALAPAVPLPSLGWTTSMTSTEPAPKLPVFPANTRLLSMECSITQDAVSPLDPPYVFVHWTTPTESVFTIMKSQKPAPTLFVDPASTNPVSMECSITDSAES
jgi:urease gamma subunit